MLDMAKITKKFKIKDSFQQLIGGLLLSGPFVVTEEVWRIADNLTTLRLALILLGNILIGYFALFEADKSRDVEVEQDIAGVPLRLISLMIVAYFSVGLLVILLAPQQTFGVEGLSVLNAIAISSIFSTVGAATADSVF